MDKNIITQAVKTVKENSPKRNFNQSFDLIINLKNVDVKKTGLDFFVQLHFSKGKKTKICALVGPELEKEAREVCDTVISQNEFQKYTKDKKIVKKLAKQHDFFIAQANIMPQVATSFGRVLGPKGKMPNPKAGCVVPPKTNLKILYERLQKTLRINAKTDPIVHCTVGKEDMNEEEIVDNVSNVYTSVIHQLPQEKNNIKSVFLKLTMGKPVLVGKPREKGEKKGKTEKKGEEKKEKIGKLEEVKEIGGKKERLQEEKKEKINEKKKKKVEGKKEVKEEKQEKKEEVKKETKKDIKKETKEKK